MAKDDEKYRWDWSTQTFPIMGFGEQWNQKPT